MSKEQILARKVDALTFCMLLLISSLRGTIKTDGGEEVVLVPKSVLDSIESIIKNQ